MKVIIVMRPGTHRLSIAKVFAANGCIVESCDSFHQLFSSVDLKVVPHLVIVELKMDDPQAWRYCGLLRSQKLSVLHDVPVLAVSHLYSLEYGRVAAQAMGADAYFKLSSDSEQLIEEAFALATRQAGHSHTHCALCVVDDPVFLRMVVNTFTKNKWMIDTVHSVEEAKKQIRLKKYDAFIVDYHLPDGKGDELLQEINTTADQAPAIMMTADATAKLALDWLEIGASAYLLKPFSPQYLFETCLRCIKEKMWRGLELQLEDQIKRLKERESLIDDFENIIGDVIWMRNLDLKYTYVSPSVVDVTGFTAEQTLELELEQEMTADSAARLRKSVATLLEAKKEKINSRNMLRGVFVLYHRDGKTFSAEVALHVKFDVSGEPVAIIGRMRDISQEVESQDKYSSLHTALAQADDTILITDAEGRLIYANDSYQRITGFKPKDWLATGDNILIHGAEDESFYQDLWSTLSEGQSWAGEVSNIRKDGSTFRERVKISPIRNNKNEVVRFVAVKHDLTHELELVNEKQEIEEKYLQVQRLEAIGALATGIIHDFNNILTPIVGYANLLKVKYNDDELIQDHVSQILLAGERAKNLVKQILTFSRGSQKIHEPISLHLLVKENVKMMRAFLPPKITISVHTNDVYPKVLIDPTKFSQLFMNLVTNSFQAIDRKDGKIHIYLENADEISRGKVIRLRVTDNGKGIPPTIQKDVFTPFFTTKTDGKGTGLGLSVCKSITEEAGGKIEIEHSSVGSGTTICVTLPARFQEDESNKVKQLCSKRFDGNGKKVLLIDDDKIVLDYLATALSRLNFTVDSFADSREAEQAFLDNSKEYFIAFTDIEMPNKDGFEIVRNIRNVRQGLPVIICTGSDNPEVNELANTLDKVFILKKPVTLTDVSAALTQLIEKHERAASIA